MDVISERFAGMLIGNRYRIDQLIGRGGMATVYKAYDLMLQREIAVKFPDTTLLHDPQFALDFEAEMRSVARLKHPNVVSVYDAGQIGGTPYLVMEYVQYGSVLNLMQPGQYFAPRQVSKVVSQIAAGLDHAHAAGLVHRDVKPGNLLAELDGSVKLTDFGLAKLRDTAPSGPTMGTPLYMAPEQLLNQPATPATDIYALGVIAYELLTGRRPFEGDDMSVQSGHLYQPPPSPRSHNPALAPAVEQVVLRALAKEPGRRYQSAGEFARALEAAVNPARIKPWMGPAAAVALVAMLVLLAFAGYRGFEQRRVDGIVAAADAALNEGRIDQAIADYERALDEDQGRLREAHRLVLLYGLRSRLPEAEARARASLAQAPASAEALAWLSYALWHEQRFDQALVEAEAAVAAEPDNPMGHIASALALAELAYKASDREQLADAAAAADRAITLAEAAGASGDDLTRALAYNARGLVHWNEYQLTEEPLAERAAIDNGTELFNRALGLVKLPWFRYNLGVFHLFEGRRELEQGRRAEAEASFAKAQAEFARILASDPRYHDAHAGQGWVLLEQERYDEAIAAFEAALPTDDRTFAVNGYLGLNQANRYKATPDYEAALAAIERALELRPNNDGLLSDLGWTYLEQEQYAEAEQSFKELLEREPRSVEAHTGLSWVYRYSDEPDYDQARAVLEAAAQIDDRNPGVLSNLGSTYSEQAGATADESDDAALYAEAIKAFDQALAIDPNFLWALRDRGWAYVNLGQYDQAAASFGEAIDRSPDYLDAYIGLGWTRYYEERYDEAEAAFLQAAAIDPDSAEPYYNLGQTLYRRSLYAEAEEQFRTAIQVEPEHAESNHWLGFSLFVQARYAEAEESFRRASTIDSTYDFAHSLLGWSLFYQERYEEAVEPFQKAIELNAEYADAMYGLGQTYEQLGDIDQARELFRQAVELDSEDRNYQEALERVGG